MAESSCGPQTAFDHAFSYLVIELEVDIDDVNVKLAMKKTEGICSIRLRRNSDLNNLN